jgi:DNA topoisomerase-1
VPGHVLARIRALAIPPAWEDVWICPDDHGHLQATGRDAKGRKQYRYHARWREARDETKYGRVRDFAAALPRLRRRVARDLQLPGLPREKAMATVVRLLETTFIRIGNEQYARENESFGLTTLRAHQVSVRGGRLHFRFRGKSGVQHSIQLSDRALAAIVRRMQDLPGEELFQYVDDDGQTRTIESADVNAYLKEATGEAFTSKDFRTWAGTVLAIGALRAAEPPASLAQANRNVARAVEYVSSRLGNTKAVCRKCYIHPGVMERYLDGTFPAVVRGRTDERAVAALVDATRRSLAARARRSGADGRSLAGVLKASLERRRNHARGVNP